MAINKRQSDRCAQSISPSITDAIIHSLVFCIICNVKIKDNTCY
ncbi:hypothetical protein MY1_0450 [Nitrosarchaeum koreense MY1]|uniref:Uncharacterized protein n=1 Tax=Nitrosarchaeum koreense MY1 TaxID=1001994 RepID=F9CVB6_9ARCH|nr:hypothetical protein MY1_0450 [Nitrosarchaeum koreense MY1]